MAKNQGESMIQCLDAIEEINERLTRSLRKCEELIDRPSPLGDDETIWVDVFHRIKRIITASESIVQKNRELLN